MPSEKLTRILKSKSSFSIDEINKMTETSGWDWVYSYAIPKKEKISSVCFTGFSQTEKLELTEMANNSRFRVVGSVSNSLSFLCVGENAGPAKLEKAKECGIVIMTRAEFIDFLETGEIPI